MKKEEILILEREDMIENHQGKDIHIIDFTDFKISVNKTLENSILLFIDKNGDTKILKNRFGNNSSLTGSLNLSMLDKLGGDIQIQSKNKLIIIGYIGLKKCYLNITEEEAIERYCKTENITRQKFDKEDISIHTTEFDDEFCAYDVWDKNKQ